MPREQSYRTEKKLNPQQHTPMSVLHKINKVKEFHEVFRLDYRETPTAELDPAVVELRHRLMEEENEEYLEACRNKDLAQIADALGDKMYILFGTILAHGLQYKIEEIFDEIHRSNMSKLDEKGEPIYREDGKILKSKNYFLPDIEAILVREDANLKTLK
jgi:predicted HAD superfamily Cof-like phosphohydrolase